MSNQNKYFVRLTIVHGEHEKGGKHLVAADDEQEARTSACEMESHHDDAGWDDEKRWWNDGFEFSYKVDSVELLTEQEYETLRKYL
jgi:hypothetical protein